jgi:putative ABC transport system permease protein
VDSVLQDLRFGLRMLRRQRAFAIAALLVLTLGIGANVVVFSLIQTMYFQRLPVPGADRLLTVFASRPGTGEDRPLSMAEFAYVRDHARSFESVAAHYSSAPINLVDRGDSREINGSVVTASFFEVLRLRPALGRFFLAEDDRVAGRNAVAVVSHAMWQRRLDADPAVLGRTLVLNGTAFTIVGVAPRGFAGVAPGGLATDVWLPSAMFRVGYRSCDALHDPDCRIVRLVARLAPGVEMRTAQADVATLGAQIAAAAAEPDDRGRTIAAAPLQGARLQLTADEASVPILLAAAVAAVLLVACANLAGLLLARGLARRREVAVRFALGASRARVFRQMLIEALLLATAGGVAGLVAAYWCKDLLAAFYAFNTEGQRANFTLELNGVTLAFTAAVSCATVVAFAVLPALRATRRDVVAALTHGVAASPAMRMHGTLVAGQVACAVVLLSASALLAQSVANIHRGPGYNPAGVLLLRLRPSLVGQTPARAAAFQRSVIERLRHVPGVIAAAPAAYPPLPGWGPSLTLWRAGSIPASPDAAYRTAMNAVGPDYLRAIELPLVAGRDFDDRDTQGAPRAAIVNEVVARVLWPGEDAIGSGLIMDGITYRVVGIVKAAQYHASAAAPGPLVLVNYWQTDDVGKRAIDSRTHIRVSGSVASMLPLIRREVVATDPTVPISEDRPLDEWLEYFFRPVRATAAAVSAFAALALVLSVLGVYAVVAGIVTQRRREIALRMALGADTGHIGRWVIGQGVMVAGTGALAGAAAASLSARVLSAYLYGVSAHDLGALAGASGLLGLTALAAAWIPARRAATINPIVALRGNDE